MSQSSSQVSPNPPPSNTNAPSPSNSNRNTPRPTCPPSAYPLCLPLSPTPSAYPPPGLIYRMVQPKIVLLVFVSGKVVLTGGKVRNEIYAAFEQIYPVLQEFRKAAAPVAGALQ